MTGGSFTIYSGARRQRGGGIFGSMRSYLAPVARKAFSGVKSFARNKTVQKIAKQAAQKGAEVLTSATVDALQGRDFGESIKSRIKQTALNTLTGQSYAAPETPQRVETKLKQSRKRPLPITNIKQSRKRTLPITNTYRSQPKRKRRRRGQTTSLAALNREELF